MKKITIIGLTIIMFFFKNSATANYDKIFFDFKVDSISGEIIDLNDYKNKVVLIVILPVIVVLQNNMLSCKHFGRNTNPRV